MGKTLAEFMNVTKKSPFEATNQEIADSRFYDDIGFKSEEERNLFCKLGEPVIDDERKRLEIGMKHFGYDNAEKLRKLNS